MQGGYLCEKPEDDENLAAVRKKSATWPLATSRGCQGEIPRGFLMVNCVVILLH